MTSVTHPAPTAAPPLLLASASPRRRALLAALGARFEVVPADVDEDAGPGEAPEATAARLAAAKAAAVAERRPEARVLAADTVVILDGASLGKPRDAAENRAFLRRLAGVPHTVVTAHVLRGPEGAAAASVATEVRLRRLRDHEIERWARSGEGLDKAGGYAIQDLGAALVDEVHGCYSNVVGLSLPAVVALAAQLGVDLV
jgi:septum formation protein